METRKGCCDGRAHDPHGKAPQWDKIKAGRHVNVKTLREQVVAEVLVGCNYGSCRDCRKARARVAGSVAGGWAPLRVRMVEFCRLRSDGRESDRSLK